MSAPANAASGPRIPASEHDGTAPGGGGASNRQRRHPPGPAGATLSTCAVVRSTPPCTSGRRIRSAASLARNLVAKLSDPSTTTSAARTSSSAFAGPKRTSRASISTRGNSARSRATAADALRAPRSASTKSGCRLRFEVSTTSSSTRRIRPSPPAARTSRAGPPRPPAPTTSALFVARCIWDRVYPVATGSATWTTWSWSWTWSWTSTSTSTWTSTSDHHVPAVLRRLPELRKRDDPVDRSAQRGGIEAHEPHRRVARDHLEPELAAGLLERLAQRRGAGRGGLGRSPLVEAALRPGPERLEEERHGDRVAEGRCRHGERHRLVPVRPAAAMQEDHERACLLAHVHVARHRAIVPTGGSGRHPPRPAAGVAVAPPARNCVIRKSSHRGGRREEAHVHRTGRRKARRPPARPRGRCDDAHRGRRSCSPRHGEADRLAHADVHGAAREADREALAADPRARAARRPLRPLLRRLGRVPRRRLRIGDPRPGARAGPRRRAPRAPRRGEADEGRLLPGVRATARRAEREEGADEARSRRAPPRGHPPVRLAERLCARRHGLVRVDGGVPAADRRARRARGVRAGDGG